MAATGCSNGLHNKNQLSCPTRDLISGENGGLFNSTKDKSKQSCLCFGFSNNCFFRKEIIFTQNFLEVNSIICRKMNTGVNDYTGRFILLHFWVVALNIL